MDEPSEGPDKSVADEQEDLIEATCVEEAEEISKIVIRVTQSQGDAATACFDRWKSILSKYQEDPQLLDSLLESIVTPLAELLRTLSIELHASPTAPQPWQRILGVCRLLNVLVTVRGYKTSVKFFPHDAADLETVLNVLLIIKEAGKTGTLPGSKGHDAEEGLALWETQMMLLLWLSMLILIPFALSTVDTAATLETSSTAASAHPYTLLVSRVMTLCKDYLHHPGGVREMAALLLGRLLTRPDQASALREFLAWSHTQLDGSGEMDAVSAPFLIPGVLQALCLVFKLGKRTDLLPHAPSAWEQLMKLHTQQTGAGAATSSHSGVLARKLTIKLTQRVAMTFLKPRLAPWRYQRADADIEARLGAAEQLEAQAGDGAGDEQEDGEQEGDEFEVVEEIEEVIEVLLSALTDKDTVVRWSAAKGVGRVTGCLPKELGDEVVESLITLFKPTESDTAWHGGCLALAELARRGLLLPERLTALTPIIQTALLYDVRRGPHSVGAHVRDAAAYVCWAFARAYAPDVMSGTVHVLGITLLIVACYDREVNCRRAAAAAFQECVGRLGYYPNGIELMTIADYFAVGNINNAYTSVAPSLARFPTYQLPLAQHLVTTQLRHWEKPLRQLTARGLAALVPAVGREYLSTGAVDYLLPLCTDPVLEARHGAVVGLAELLPALHQEGVPLTVERQQQIAGVIPAIDKARLYRGKGGEVLREAVSGLTAAMSKVALPLTAQQHAKVLEALDENLRHPHAVIQKSAVSALKQYTRAYVSSPDAITRFTRFFDGYIGRLHDPNVAVRRGYAAALGVLPRHLLAPRAQEVLSALISGTQLEEDPDERDTDSRAACVRSLHHVCGTLYGPPETEAAPSSTAVSDSAAGATQPDAEQAVTVILQQVLPCLHTCMCDYTTDNRGDVGSWVREAGMEGLVGVTHLLHLNTKPDTGSQVVAEVLPGVASALAKQGVERIARVREAAMRHLISLLSTPHLAALLPAAAALSAAVPRDDSELTGVVSLEAVRKLAGLMPASHVYRAPLLEGLVCSVGGVDAQLSKVATSALLSVLEPSLTTTTSTANQNVINASLTSSDAAHTNGSVTTSAPTTDSAPDHSAFLTSTVTDFISIWRQHARSSRMAGPLLRTAHLLVTRCSHLLHVHVAEHVAAGTAPASQPAPAAASRPLCEVLVELGRAETRQCGDVGRLLEASVLLCQLAASTGTLAARHSAYQGLLVLLANKYPKVRRYTAEQLYVALLPLQPDEVGGPEGGISSEAVETVTDLLLTTPWDTTLDAAKAGRDALAAALQVAVPAMKAAAKGSGQGKAGQGDAYESYQSLIDDFARGM